MYTEKQWLGHVTEFEDRYTEQDNGDGTITHTPVEGEVLQEGTPQSAKNFNHIECGISEAHETAAALLVMARHARQQLEDLAGETIRVTLTNSEQYPFNNSKKTVALAVRRNNGEYTVTPEVVSVEGGGLKNVSVSDKLANGFKVEFYGSATSVTLKLHVKGGFYSG